MDNANVNDLKAVELKAQLSIRGVAVKGLKKPQLRTLLEDARLKQLPISVLKKRSFRRSQIPTKMKLKKKMRKSWTKIQ